MAHHSLNVSHHVCVYFEVSHTLYCTRHASCTLILLIKRGGGGSLTSAPPGVFSKAIACGDDAIIIALVVEVLGTFGAPPADRLHLECKDAGTLH